MEFIDFFITMAKHNLVGTIGILLLIIVVARDLYLAIKRRNAEPAKLYLGGRRIYNPETYDEVLGIKPIYLSESYTRVMDALYEHRKAEYQRSFAGKAELHSLLEAFTPEHFVKEFSETYGYEIIIMEVR